ncbi:hypothetical protein [Lysobacter solisilvae (ex Woo and Kim 2020)]|uniref:Uncharacterized protein n=1 Tax=Agrilutibacter terrestris TaxID=2865112 RepID=A0A7H0FVV5_9GAMM|nr:hypothetical protein [Lysobacter terrestris]QNP40171.1 hypothetical protein H8B22_11825 [Lysobacter terrestris]
MTIATQILEILALLLFLAGCVLLHVRLRRFSSLSLLISIPAFVAWLFWGQDVFLRAVPAALGTGTASDLRDLGQWLSVATIISAVLLVWLATSFFLTVKAVRPTSRHAA